MNQPVKRIFQGIFIGIFLAIFVFHSSVGSALAEERRHVVQPGETLSQIAAQYEIPMAQLMEINGISDSNSLRVGQELILPDPNAPTPTPKPIVHVVAAGESLAAIAAQFGVSEEAILEANGINSATELKWGQRLTIPLPTPTGTPPTAVPATASATATSTIKPETPTLEPSATEKRSPETETPAPTETSTKVAETEAAIEAEVTATRTPIAEIIHTVRGGETASGIAESYGIPMSRLLEANNIANPNSIVIGQQLIIPDVKATETPVPQPTESEVEEGNAGASGTTPSQIVSLNRTYKVSYPNDSIGYIALRYGLDPEALRALNRMPSVRSPVEVGTELLLPATDRELYVQPNVPPTQLHILQSGESLQGIANDNDLTLGDLMYANRIGNPDTVEVGQELVIPQKDSNEKVKSLTPQIGVGRAGYFFYTIRSGDTASQLAEKFNTNGNAIVMYNDFANLDTIILGMEIRVPFGPPALPVRQPPVPMSGTSFVVSIGRQECWVFWGKNIAHHWNCSTGFGDYKTRLGNFAVQSRIEMARSSAYQLDMPYWLGIYNVGSYENGIHGLPIDLWKNEKIWTSLVGQPATFGCAMLDDRDAEELFNMSYLGMPVYVIK